MQDSIEDYIKISKNTRKDPNEDTKISREEIIATAQRKKECEDYAMKIVMFLLDGKLRSEIFLKCLKYINQDYYQDVVDERAISKLCGYPLCGKKIPDMPSKKYFISTKVNKVYDIGERKKYCSNFCYNGSLHIKNQIDSSPLWLRNYREMAEYTLIHPTAVGAPGEEIDHGIIKASSELPQFTSVTHFTQISLEEVEEIEKSSKGGSKLNMKHTYKQPSLNVIKEDDLGDSQSDKDDCKHHTNDHTNKNKENGNRMSEKEKLDYLISKLKINNKPKTKLIDPPPIKLKPKKKVVLCDNQQVDIRQNKDLTSLRNENTGNVEVLTEIKTCVIEWITLDTFIYIYGEDKVRQVLNENKMEEYFEKLRIVHLEMPQQLKYMNICRRLHMQELAEEKFDNAILGHSLKPLPNFKQLKHEVEGLDLKVKSFYKGASYEQVDTNFPNKPVKENEKGDEESAVVVPLVDVSAQKALRRKVFLSSINKTLKKLIAELKLEESSVLASIQELVKSFKLQAHNVVFRPASWSLIALVLIKILSMKDKNIQHQLEEPESFEHIDLILVKYTGAKQIIDEILSLLIDVDKFVECYITRV